MAENNLTKLTGIWLNKDKNGKVYMSGNLGGARVVILKNNFKEEDKHPDYNLYVAPFQKKAEEDDILTQAEELALLEGNA